jgi:hypothetical protein
MRQRGAGGDGMPGARRPHRVGRWWWPDANPLRRSCDRAEAAIIAGLFALFLIGGALAAIAAGQWAYASTLRAEHGQQAGLHRVNAVLLAAAPYGATSGYGVLAMPQAKARWQPVAGGVWRTGQVPAPAGTKAGATVTLWVNAAGRPAGPPLLHKQVVGQTVLAALLAPALLACLLAGAAGVTRRVFDRRRIAAWDADWRSTGPRWTSRR